MDSIQELLVDWHHWLGWLISASAIFIIFWILITNYTINIFVSFIILLVIIVIVDVIKHQINLQ